MEQVLVCSRAGIGEILIFVIHKQEYIAHEEKFPKYRVVVEESYRVATIHFPQLTRLSHGDGPYSCIVRTVTTKSPPILLKLCFYKPRQKRPFSKQNKVKT